MADTNVNNANAEKVWIKEAVESYTRISGFKPYMSPSDDAIIRIRYQLMTSSGAVISTPLILELNGRGVEGSEVLEGNEEQLDNFADEVRVRHFRNGFTVPKSASFLTSIDLFNAGKARLTRWSGVKLRNDIISAFRSIIIPGVLDADNFQLADTVTSYEASTAAQRNTYLATNIDRILFGNATANAVSGNWATALGTVDAVNDKMSALTIRIAKNLAKQTTNAANGIAINPYSNDATAGREYYVMFMGSEDFANASIDPIIYNANKDARPRNLESNPVFQGGDLIYDGVILREVPEMTPLLGAGAAGVNVGRSFLCGQGAVTLAYGQMPKLIPDLDRDYKFRPSFAVEELRGQKKASYKGVLYGAVEVLTAATPVG